MPQRSLHLSCHRNADVIPYSNTGPPRTCTSFISFHSPQPSCRRSEISSNVAHSARPTCHTAEMRTSSHTPIRDLLAPARRSFPSVHPNRHAAVVRYPATLPIAIDPPVIPQQCGIQSHGFKRDRITHPNCHTAEMRTSSHTPIRDLLAPARRSFPSVHPKRHTAEMRYPVARPQVRQNYSPYYPSAL